MSKENDSTSWRNTCIEQEEVKKAIEKANRLIDSNKADLLLAHSCNREFKRRNNLSSSQIYSMAKKAAVMDFCHIEPDSKKPTDFLYCFKLHILLSEDTPEEVLYKFKFRRLTDAEELFIMSFHYPDKDKEPWVHLWK